MLATLESMSQTNPSTLKTYAFRLAPEQDVKKSILDFAKQNKIKAGCILSVVGSLKQLNVRFANQPVGTRLKGYYEVVSMSGIFSDSSSHIHIAVSDDTGRTTGGHLLEDSLVYTTLEVVVGELSEYEFSREKDPTYGQNELVAKLRSNLKK